MMTASETPVPQAISPGVFQAPSAVVPAFCPDPIDFRQFYFTDELIFETGYPVAKLPPLTSTSFVAVDGGCASPRFLRFTLYKVPQTAVMLTESQLPLGAIIQPLAPLVPEEEPIPEVKCAPEGPLRCHRCRAYISPLAGFINHSRRYKCAFCDAATVVPENQRVLEIYNTEEEEKLTPRPELMKGTYEFLVASGEDDPLPTKPAMLFCIDVSREAVFSGMVGFLCDHLAEIALQALPKTMLMGILTYDTTLHFYKLTSPVPYCCVVSDTDDPFVPFEDGLFVSPADCIDNIQAALDAIRATCDRAQPGPTILTATVKTALTAFKSTNRVGKVVLFQAAGIVSNAAEDVFRTTENSSVLGTVRQHEQLAPAHSHFGELGAECTKSGIGVDLFVFPKGFMDLATLTPLARVSGGTLYHYPGFSPDNSDAQNRFYRDLEHDLRRQTAFKTKLRVRVSPTLKITHLLGPLSPEISGGQADYCLLGSLDADKAFAVTLQMAVPKIGSNSEEYVGLQVVLQYTDVAGVRRIRVINSFLGFTSDLNVVYRRADIDAVVTYFAKVADRQSRDGDPEKVRLSLGQRCLHLLAHYKAHCVAAKDSQVLVLPDALQLLPLYISCLDRCNAVFGGNDLPVDEKAYLMAVFPALSVEATLRYLYPTVTPLGKSSFKLKPPIRASFVKFDREKVHLVDDGFTVFCWFYPVTNVESLATAVYAAASANQNDREHQSKFVYALPGSDGERAMQRRLMEDASAPNCISYADIIVKTHFAIRKQVSTDT